MGDATRRSGGKTAPAPQHDARPPREGQDCLRRGINRVLRDHICTLKSIAWCKLTFDWRGVLHRVATSRGSRPPTRRSAKLTRVYREVSVSTCESLVRLRSWSHFVGSYCQELNQSPKIDFLSRFERSFANPCSPISNASRPPTRRRHARVLGEVDKSRVSLKSVKSKFQPIVDG